ncbi:hypothetical protein CONLIGDRAFT_18280 [Coniochaeta ligniaria NRRL 30616]|uniref:Uncharacterized protein n=1 Tax=Coniochaeta ligniaria NRRL 30616 TaxID=1408157 RepID=A0A1J7J4N9_9PEZI|nr:hypothetical protein CONLIGDRAFT_18280 [Coniochaeta ligniaria NRRL 30616]
MDADGELRGRARVHRLGVEGSELDCPLMPEMGRAGQRRPIQVFPCRISDKEGGTCESRGQTSAGRACPTTRRRGRGKHDPSYLENLSAYLPHDHVLSAEVALYSTGVISLRRSAFFALKFSFSNGRSNACRTHHLGAKHRLLSMYLFIHSHPNIRNEHPT